MRPSVFLLLNTIGTIGGLLMVRAAGLALQDQIASLVAAIGEYQWWLTGASVAVVAGQLLRARRRRIAMAGAGIAGTAAAGPPAEQSPEPGTV